MKLSISIFILIFSLFKTSLAEAGYPFDCRQILSLTSADYQNALEYQDALLERQLQYFLGIEDLIPKDAPYNPVIHRVPAKAPARDQPYSENRIPAVPPPNPNDDPTRHREIEKPKNKRGVQIYDISGEDLGGADLYENADNVIQL